MAAAADGQRLQGLSRIMHYCTVSSHLPLQGRQSHGREGVRDAMKMADPQGLRRQTCTAARQFPYRPQKAVHAMKEPRVHPLPDLAPKVTSPTRCPHRTRTTARAPSEYTDGTTSSPLWWWEHTICLDCLSGWKRLVGCCQGWKVSKVSVKGWSMQPCKGPGGAALQRATCMTCSSDDSKSPSLSNKEICKTPNSSCKIAQRARPSLFGSVESVQP